MLSTDNFYKLKLLSDHLQTMIKDGLIAPDGECGTIPEEIYSCIEILSQCDEEWADMFDEDMRKLNAAVMPRKKTVTKVYYRDEETPTYTRYMEVTVWGDVIFSDTGDYVLFSDGSQNYKVYTKNIVRIFTDEVDK